MLKIVLFNGKYGNFNRILDINKQFKVNLKESSIDISENNLSAKMKLMHGYKKVFSVSCSLSMNLHIEYESSWNYKISIDKSKTNSKLSSCFNNKIKI